MTLEDIVGKKVETITKGQNGGYWVVLEDGSAVGFSPSMRQIDNNTFNLALDINSLPAKGTTPDANAEKADI
jgi:hypothetical protein